MWSLRVFVEAVHDDCRVLFLVEVKPHINKVRLVQYKLFPIFHFETQATSTDKPVSPNYALGQRGRHGWYSQSIPRFWIWRCSCRKQATKKETPSPWCVMLTLKRSDCKSFFQGSKILVENKRFEGRFPLCQRTKTEKSEKNAQINLTDTQSSILLPLWEPVLTLCAILGKGLRQLPIMDDLSLVEEMWKTWLLWELPKIQGRK